MANTASRTIFVTVKTAFHTEAPRNVRFAGSIFRDLKERLASVNLPGIGKDSFVEVRMGDEAFLCLLDEEKLPEGDLFVNVHNSSDGLQLQKSLSLDAFAAPSIQLHIGGHITHRKSHRHSYGHPGHPHEHSGHPPEHPSHSHEHPDHPHEHSGHPPEHPSHSHEHPGHPHEHPGHLRGPHHHGDPFPDYGDGHLQELHHQEQGSYHFYGPPHDGHDKGRRGEKLCGRHKRHHPSLDHGRLPSIHRHGRHCNGRRRHASRSRSPSGSTSRSQSPPVRGGVAVHIHHHGPRFHGRGMHHFRRFQSMGKAGHKNPSQKTAVAATPSQVEEQGEEGDWQEVSETRSAAKALESLAV